MAGKDKAALTRALAKEKAALDRGVITRAEYNSRVAQLSRRFETASGMAERIATAGRNAQTASKATTALRVAGAAKGVARVAGKLAGPVGVGMGIADAATRLSTKEGLKSVAASRKAVMEAAAGKGSKGDSMFDTAAKAKKAALAKKAAVAKARGTMLPADRGSRGKNTSKTYTEGRRADNASSASPSTKTPSNGSKTPSSGSVHVVKRGDTLWDIAQANNTTVSTLLKLNPTIAKRKADGKVDIFSGSKVRLPKGK